MITRKIGFAFLILYSLFIGVLSAFAVAPEMCGNGFDDPLQTGGSANGTKGSCPGGYMDAAAGLGCDKICPGIDGDLDGVTNDGTIAAAGTTDTDCDDADPNIYTGIVTTKGCTGGQTHTCQANGTYTTCTATTVCRATGSGVCKYIHCGTGSDAAAGTFAAPYKSLAKVSGGSAGSGLPASPYTLQPGDDVEILGGNCNTTLTDTSGIASLFDFSANGTNSNWITINVYPGATPTFTNTNGFGGTQPGNYYKYFGFDISTQRSSVASATSFFVTGEHARFEQIYGHDFAGHGDNNDAVIYCSGTNDCQVLMSRFKDIKANTGNLDNIAAITWLDDPGSGNGSGHEARGITVLCSTFNENVCRIGLKDKHGPNKADLTGNGVHILKDIHMVQVPKILSWAGSGLRASNWRAYKATTAFQFIVDQGKMEDNEFSYASLQNSSYLSWGQPPFTSTAQKFTMNHVAITDDRASYNDSAGIVSFAGYGSDAQITSFESNTNLVIDNNCYYNAVTPANFAYFDQSGGVGWGPAGAGGGNYAFSAWQALTPPYDTNSHLVDPDFDADLSPQEPQCSGVGYQYSGVVGPTPTPTPSLSGQGFIPGYM